MMPNKRGKSNEERVCQPHATLAKAAPTNFSTTTMRRDDVITAEATVQGDDVMATTVTVIFINVNSSVTNVDDGDYHTM